MAKTTAATHFDAHVRQTLCRGQIGFRIKLAAQQLLCWERKCPKLAKTMRVSTVKSVSITIQM